VGAVLKGGLWVDPRYIKLSTVDRNNRTQAKIDGILSVWVSSLSLSDFYGILFSELLCICLAPKCLRVWVHSVGVYDHLGTRSGLFFTLGHPHTSLSRFVWQMNAISVQNRKIATVHWKKLLSFCQRSKGR